MITAGDVCRLLLRGQSQFRTSTLLVIAVVNDHRTDGARRTRIPRTAARTVTRPTRALVLVERFTRRLVQGVLVACAGAVLIGAATAEGHRDRLGSLFCLLAAMTYAIGVVAQKPPLRRLPALQVTWLGCLAGTLACLP